LQVAAAYVFDRCTFAVKLQKQLSAAAFCTFRRCEPQGMSKNAELERLRRAADELRLQQAAIASKAEELRKQERQSQLAAAEDRRRQLRVNRELAATEHRQQRVMRAASWYRAAADRVSEAELSPRRPKTKPLSRSMTRTAVTCTPASHVDPLNRSGLSQQPVPVIVRAGDAAPTPRARDEVRERERRATAALLEQRDALAQAVIQRLHEERLQRRAEAEQRRAEQSVGRVRTHLEQEIARRASSLRQAEANLLASRSTSLANTSTGSQPPTTRASPVLPAATATLRRQRSLNRLKDALLISEAEMDGARVFRDEVERGRELEARAKMERRTAGAAARKRSLSNEARRRAEAKLVNHAEQLEDMADKMHSRVFDVLEEPSVIASDC
jgi:hypothetical protein